VTPNRALAVIFSPPPSRFRCIELSALCIRSVSRFEPIAGARARALHRRPGFVQSRSRMHESGRARKPVLPAQLSRQLQRTERIRPGGPIRRPLGNVRVSQSDGARSPARSCHGLPLSRRSTIRRVSAAQGSLTAARRRVRKGAPSRVPPFLARRGLRKRHAPGPHLRPKGYG
jgi:hypothetical protein